MPRPALDLRLLAATLALGMCIPLGASAACSRVINVPISAIGQSVIVEGEAISGIYPDLLRGLAEKEGCPMALTAVPRARLEIMFETGRADLLIPATKTPKRDANGTFIGLIHNRPMLISIQSNRHNIKTTRELLDQPIGCFQTLIETVVDMSEFEKLQIRK